MLAALATTTDLADRGITIPASMSASAILASASAAVRDAAGCSISYGPSTVTLVADDPCEIELPGGPVASVASVTVAGVPVTGWTKIGDTLQMPSNWTQTLPVEVVVTYTHGYQVIPADIVDLVCGIAQMAFNAEGDYGTGGLRRSVRLGDFAETYEHPPGTHSPSPVALPDAVRQELRVRFGTSAAAVGLR